MNNYHNINFKSVGDNILLNKIYTSIYEYGTEYIENPITMVIGGSRMCAYPDDDSDWDVFCIFQSPTVSLLGLQKPQFEILTPKVTIENRRLSIRGEEVEQIFNKMLDGNIKFLEKIYSPLIVMDNNHLDNFRILALTTVSQKTFKNYFEKIHKDINCYYATKEVKPLLYAYRRSMTVYLLSQISKVIVDSTKLKEYFPKTYLQELIDAKICKKYFNKDTNALEDINNWLNKTKNSINKIPHNPTDETIAILNKYLLNLREQDLLINKNLSI